MKRKLSDQQISSIADGLLGTCGIIDDFLPDGVSFDDLLEDDCLEIDGKVMCCETCGWWAESELIDDDGNCDECGIDD